MDCFVCQEQPAVICIGLFCDHQMCCQCTVQHFHISPNTSCPACRQATHSISNLTSTLHGIVKDEWVWRTTRVGLVELNQTGLLETVHRLLSEPSFPHKHAVLTTLAQQIPFSWQHNPFGSFRTLLSTLTFDSADQQDHVALCMLWNAVSLDLQPARSADANQQLKRILELFLTKTTQTSQIVQKVVSAAQILLIINMLVNSVSLRMLHMTIAQLAETIPVAQFLLAQHLRQLSETVQDVDTQHILQHTSTKWLYRCCNSLPMARQHLALHHFQNMGVPFKNGLLAHLFCKLDAHWSSLSHYNAFLLHRSRVASTTVLRKDCFYNMTDSLPIAAAQYLKGFVFSNIPSLSTVYRLDVQYWLEAARLGSVESVCFLAAQHSLHHFYRDEIGALVVNMAAHSMSPICLAAVALSGQQYPWSTSNVKTRISMLQQYFEILPFAGSLPTSALFDRHDVTFAVTSMLQTLTSYQPLYRDLKFDLIMSEQMDGASNTTQLEHHLVQFPDHFHAWIVLLEFLPPGSLPPHCQTALLQPALLQLAMQQHQSHFLHHVLFLHFLFARISDPLLIAQLEQYCNTTGFLALKSRFLLFEIQTKHKYSRVDQMVKIAEEGDLFANRVLAGLEPCSKTVRDRLLLHKPIAIERCNQMQAISTLWNQDLMIPASIL